MSLNVSTAGAGPALLLLHGFTGTARSWSLHIDAWARHHRVVAPDLLGHGGSEAPAEPAAYQLERQADTLAELLRLLEAVPASVVGYSMGARLALVLALQHPQLVDALVLESPSAGIADPADREARAAADGSLASEIERDGVPAFVERWEALPLFASHAALPESTRAAQRQQRLRSTASGLAASLRGAGQGRMTPLHERLGEIAAPSLVIAGSLDRVGLERARLVADGIPAARLEIIDDAGHSPHLETPERYGGLVTDFLAASQPTR